MKNWLDIIKEFTTEDKYDIWFSTYDEEPFLIIDSYYGKRFIEDFNKWFKETEYYKQLEEDTIMYNYDTFFLEALNANWGYSDEYELCYECGNVVRIGDYADKHWKQDGLIICESCTRENAESYIYEYLVYNYNTGVPESNFHINQILSETELEEHGFKKYSKEYEVGFYGTYDDPHEILTEYVNVNKDTDYIINLVSCNPFETRYQIWKRNNNPMTEERKKLLCKIALEIAMEQNIGNITKMEMRELYKQLDYEPYCKELGKAYDDLTEEDIEEIAFMKARNAGYEV